MIAAVEASGHTEQGEGEGGDRYAMAFDSINSIDASLRHGLLRNPR